MSTPSVMIIGCGSTGSLLAEQFKPLVPVVTADTSDSAKRYLAPDTTFIEFGKSGVSGAGKNPGTHESAIRTQIKEMAASNTLPGADMEVVILLHTTSGGSGAKIAELLGAQLRDMGKAVIHAFLLGRESSQFRTNSTIFLKKMIEASSAGPVVFIGHDNGPTNSTRQAADKGMVAQLKDLLYVLTTEFRGIDAEDRKRMLRPSAPGIYAMLVMAELGKIADDGTMQMVEYPTLLYPLDTKIQAASSLVVSDQSGRSVIPTNLRSTAGGTGERFATVVLTECAGYLASGILTKMAQDSTAFQAANQAAKQDAAAAVSSTMSTTVSSYDDY